MPKSAQAFTNPCYCINARRAAGALTAYYDRALAETGLSIGQFALLWILDAMGESNVTRLAEALGLERTTVVRNLKPLSTAEYISDIPGSNARDRKLTVTAKGRAALDTAIPLWKAAQKGIQGAIGQEHIQLFKELMSRLQQV